MKRKLKNNKGITLIALVVTIVVLLILAGVSISMLTGENGIITQAQQSKLQTEIGKEKEYITLSVSALKGDKMSRGDTSEITSSELQTEMNKYTDEATVTGSGTLTVTYESGRSYEVDQDGSITQKEELTPEEAKKIVFATACGEGLAVETADGTVYYYDDDIQLDVLQKIEITDEEVITTKGIREAGYNYFINNQGKVYTWGYNGYGQLGNGTNENSKVPICISDIKENVLNGKNIIDIKSDGGTVIALDSEGKVYTWGYNYYGQLGNKTDVEYSNEPICISDISGNALNGKNIVEVQNDGVIIALDNEGKVYTWGDNGDGQLGNRVHVEYSIEPICISDIEEIVLNGKNIIDIKSDGDTVIALDSEGKVYTWGNNYHGQLGNGTGGEAGDYSDNPTCISDIKENALNGKNIKKIQSNNGTMMVLDSEGKVYTWGYNRYGQLGNGTNEDRNFPICISDIEENALYERKIVKIENLDNTIIALDSSGKVYIWGVSYNTFEPICISDIKENTLNGKNIIEVKDAYPSIIALDNEGKLYGLVNIYETICITDMEGTELYNKKIKDINIFIGSLIEQIYITEDGELYVAISIMPN